MTWKVSLKGYYKKKNGNTILTIEVMRTIKFKAKSTVINYEGKWVEGYYFVDEKGLSYIYCLSVTDGWFSHTIDPETLCEYTGKATIKGNELYENDIVFEEIEQENGDVRIYFICKWIKEIGGFTLLSYGELLQYENEGWSNLDSCGIPFDLEDVEKMHYAGSYLDNVELFENN